jgi:hypothetical protein
VVPDRHETRANEAAMTASTRYDDDILSDAFLPE